MRNWMNLFEGMEIMPTRVSEGCPVVSARSPSQFENLLNASKNFMLRGMLYDNELHVWDAFYATHGAYEDSFGDSGACRLMLYDDSLEYNAVDWCDDNDNYIPHPKVRDMLLQCRPLQRIYGDKLSSIDISGNEC